MHSLSNNLRHTILFVIVLGFGILLRIFLFPSVPPSLNWDEISHGYNAFSLLESGKDEWGVSFPTIFRAYGDYKLPVYIYSTAVSIYFFGLSEFAIRLPSLIAGIFTIFISYLLVLKLFEKKENAKRIALFTALFVTISPWTLFLSKAAFEASLAIPFLLSGVYFFLRGLKNQNNLLFSSICFGLSVWTYNSARVFVPLLILFLVVLYWRHLKVLFIKDSRRIIVSLVALCVFMIPMFSQLINPVGTARYEKVSILNEATIYEIEKARNESQLPPVLTRFVYNRPVYFVTEFSKHWLLHYTPSFLFLEGGTQYQFSVPGYGLLYAITMPFVLLGLLYVFLKRDTTSYLLLFWFFAGSFASAITSEAPHVLRSITILPTPMILTAIGISSVYSFLQKNKYYLRLFSIFFTVGLFVSIAQYFYTYKTTYVKNYSWSWQYGYKEVVQYSNENSGKYDSIIVTKKYGEPHAFFLFYMKWSPTMYRNDPNLIRYEQSNWFWIDRFDKYWFVNDWEIPEEGNVFVTESNHEIDCNMKHCLLITSPDNAPSLWKKIKTVQFLDGNTAFDLYEN
jgi:4-amino-4-deoxy-L-arabinose transferase-like glycosyltransferase